MAILMLVINVIQLVSYIPQITRLLKLKKSEELSLPTWGMWVTSSACWLVYAIFELHDLKSIITYGIGFGLNMVTLLLIVIYRKGRTDDTN